MAIMNERVAIVGTAPSWRRAPWNDPGLKLCGLNDAYRLPGWPRADAWYDLHPFDHFYFTSKRELQAMEVPIGQYVRPEGHLEWLAKLQIPLWLQAEHPDWPQGHIFPKAEVETYFGRYFSSTPAWMLAHLIMQGAKEIHIYGIHLATEHEYIEQRPNFEFLIGRALGRHPITERVVKGLRYYETPDALVVLPEETPVLSSRFQYAYETRPSALLEPFKWELNKIAIKRARAIRQLRQAKWWQSIRPVRAELDLLDARLADAEEALRRRQTELAL